MHNIQIYETVIKLVLKLMLDEIPVIIDRIVLRGARTGSVLPKGLPSYSLYRIKYQFHLIPTDTNGQGLQSTSPVLQQPQKKTLGLYAPINSILQLIYSSIFANLDRVEQLCPNGQSCSTRSKLAEIELYISYNMLFMGAQRPRVFF